MVYAITTNNLYKRYGKKMVINGTNMHVQKGSVYGFVGENGSGKTTIMRLLMGLANPTKGTYKIFGVDSKNRKILKVRSRVSAIVEAPSLVPSMTAEENLKYACLYYNAKSIDVPEILKKVGLQDTGNKKVKNFSLGMRQRLGIAVLLINDPKLLLLDEPLNGLDPAGIAEVRDLIGSLNKQGITVVISSHILSELEKVATHYGFISKGKIIQEISAKELAKKCANYTQIKYKNVSALTKALKKMKIKKFDIISDAVRIYDKVKPLALLKGLEKQSIEIEEINTSYGNVEEYYLNLIGGIQND